MHLNTSKTYDSRRRFLRKLAAGGAFLSVPGLFAEAVASVLSTTPSTTQGPYYPLSSNIPLDKDNDMLSLNDASTPASVGIITYLTGRILDASGSPVRGALVELWHADREGDYIYSASSSRNSSANAAFQGFGQFLTGSDGFFKFRTVKAGLYVSRTRHNHLAVTVPGQTTRYCTQTFWSGTQYDLNGNAWANQNNSTDTVINELMTSGYALQDILDTLALNYTTIDAATGAQGGYFEFRPGKTPVQPNYPPGGTGGLVIAGAAVAGPTNSTRFKLSIPAYTNYTYEVYSNPTLFGAGSGVTNLSSATNNLILPASRTNFGWGALPFALSQTGVINTNKFTAPTNGTLNLYVDAKSAKGFYFVTFRVPGANTGVP
ncbi:MAG: hypothetical protein EPO07_16900 [Verrucomicrobia bacterium]|nr:MAG: hypothetical protein EPO07_16900 [Verrucomicrobiota bacterium]